MCYTGWQGVWQRAAAKTKGGTTVSRQANQKMKILHLARILTEQTDAEHALSVQELIHQLNLRGVECERKSIYDDIEALRDFGLAIETRRGRCNSYYLEEREFELPELKLLADAVASSRFITHKKSEELVGKLASLTSEAQASRLRRQVYVANRVKSQNEQVYYNIDTLHEALAERRKISFRYFEYTVEKKKHYRRDGAEYVMSPCALVWDDEKYYLIAYYPKYNSILHFRVDKMERIRLLEEGAETPPAELHFDPAQYTQRTFGMYGGEEETVRLRFENELIGVVLDRFGQNIWVRRDGESHFMVDVKAAVSPQFYSWLFAFGTRVQVLQPQAVANGLRDMARGVAAQYEPETVEN